MASILRLTVGSSAEQVECLDELITNILSRVSTRDLLKMSTVQKRWRTLISNPGFVHTHYKNCHKESIFFLTYTEEIPTDAEEIWPPKQYHLHCFNYQTGNLSTVPFCLEGLDSSFRNGRFEIVAASNGLLCFCPEEYGDHHLDGRVLWLYNPVTKFLKKLTLPFAIYLGALYFAEICYTQNTLKFVMAGRSLGNLHPYTLDKLHPYTLVFDSHLNSWCSGQPLPLSRSINIYRYYPLGTQVFFNGVVYFVVRVKSRDAQELEGFTDLEGLYEDVNDYLHMIVGYDVNQDQWGFSLFVPASVGFIFRLTEWEGNLLVCASISYGLYSDGHFVFWILDTEHKLWIRERELDISHELRTSWEASASGGVVWFPCSHNSVTFYHMKNRHWSRHRPDNNTDSWSQPRVIPFATFEPTLLSF